MPFAASQFSFPTHDCALNRSRRDHVVFCGEHRQTVLKILSSDFMSPSVVAYALDRLADLGIGHVFGVPGDYAFPINDAVEVHERLQWVPSAA